ncbi:uncharacterized protein A4U43_C03F20170 [Asparagus officinalis]|uniref:BED-type domain-containing protein n=1 Tax=Asparagus officinalis TaxID=4686 RepID=A0A5P1FDE1_ASPOF|nr:uncharacterized protein A4U43_C03F20170 [Asparagus officinalis]
MKLLESYQSNSGKRVTLSKSHFYLPCRAAIQRDFLIYMPSSMASNSSMSERSNSTSSEQILETPPGSTDMRWNYGKLMKKDCHLTMQCKKWMKVMKEGVNHLKQHIAGIRGEIKGCPLASDEDMQACR